MSQLFADTTVLEFGGGAAGPLATRYLADHGATVIRIESTKRPDFLRTLKMTPDTPGGLDASEHFAVLNANKLSVSLNLSMPEAVAVARRLCLWADCVAENFAPGAMARWHLDYDSLVRDRADLVMISTCLNGQSGPQRSYPGFGGQGSALAGFNHLTGWPDREPLGPYGTITDSLSPRFAALLLSSALWHRERTGHGQHIDLAQVEGGIVCLAEAVLTQVATGTSPARIGNRSAHAAPHGVFRCADRNGAERWASIVVHDDTDWQGLVDALGRPAWATDPALATLAGRLERVTEIETELQAWTRPREQDDVVTLLRASGVEAGQVHDLGDLHDDPQLAHRAHFRTVEHSVLGDHPAETHAIRFSAMEPELRHAAPRLGQHTEHVLCSLLGMAHGDYERLRDAGALA